MGENKGKGHQVTHIKDTWTKPKVGRFKDGRQGWVGQGGMLGGEVETTVLEQQFLKK